MKTFIKPITLLLILSGINWITIKFIMPFAQVSANKHIPANDMLTFIYFTLAIIILIIAIKTFRRTNNMILLLLFLTSASLLYWGNKFSSIDCTHCVA